MSLRRKQFVIVVALASLAASAPGPAVVLTDLSSALNARKSDRVLACFTRDARIHYARVLEVARGKADAKTVPGYSNSDRALVRALQRREPELLADSKNLDALATLVAGKRDDWNPELKRLQLQTTDTGTGQARGLVSIDGTPTTLVLAIVREEGRWRIQRISSPLLAPEAVGLGAAVLGISEEQTIDSIVDRILAVR